MPFTPLQGGRGVNTMKSLRKLIIRHFWGLYRIKLPIPSFSPLGFRMRWTAALRASRIIFPTYLLAGFLILLEGYGGFGTWIALLSTPVFFFLGFAWKYSYFQLWPVKWEELDREQRWDLGKMSMQIVNFPFKMTAEQLDEWYLINNYFQIKFTDFPGKDKKS